jgi:hypothetical protein
MWPKYIIFVNIIHTIENLKHATKNILHVTKIKVNEKLTLVLDLQNFKYATKK